jgi:beta-lactamase regulating signal transducer with metallopeptidase domain/protocatechuate 3,4-dioxygenase beta subunit
MILTETLNDWAEVWASLVARSLVDGSLVLVVVGIVWLGFRRRMSPQLGYCLFLLVPAKLLIPIEIPVPGWVTHASPGHTAQRIVARTTVSLPRQVSPDFVRTRSHQPSVRADLPGHRFDLPQPSGEETGYLQRTTRLPSLPVAAALSDAAPEPSEATEEPLPVLSTRAQLMIAWSAIVLGMMAYFLYTQWRFLGILRRAESVEPRTLPLDFAHLKRLAGVRRSIRLLTSPLVSTPAVHGLLRPSLLLPPDFVESVSPAQMRFVLLHELAHVARRDLWMAAFQRLVQMVYFFNPAVWIANWLIDQQREYACDDAALATGGISRRESGEAFLAVVDRANSQKPSLDPALGIFNPKHFFRRRLMRIMDTRRPIHRRLTAGSAVFLTGMAVLLLPYVQATEEPAKTGATQVGNAKEATGLVREEAKSAKVSPAGRRNKKISAFGSVIDADGKPLSGVTVYLREWSTYRISENPFDRNPQDILATTESDERGEFRFPDVEAPGFRDSRSQAVPWDVVATAEGYAVGWRHLPAANDTAPLEIKLVDEARITGQVSDADGRPVPDARVEVGQIASLGSSRSPDRSASTYLDLQSSRLAPAAKTDSRGRVTIDRLPPDARFLLLVTHDDHQRETVYVVSSDESQPDVETRSYVDNKWTTVAKKVDARAFTLKMQPRGPRLTGRITFADTGKPCGGSKMMLSWESRYLFTISDRDGRYVFDGDLPSKSDVFVWAPEGTDYLGRKIRFTAPDDGSDVEHDVELPPGEILTGSVVDEDTAEGVPGVRVSHGPFRLKDSGELLAGHNVFTDAHGNFRIPVPPGKSVLAIHGPVEGYVTSSRPLSEDGIRDPQFARHVDVAAGRKLDEVRFRLRRGVTVSGIVTDPDGKPVAGARVETVRGNDGGSYGTKMAETGPDGRFTLTSLPSGSGQRLKAIYRRRALLGEASEFIHQDGDTSRFVADISLKPAAVVKGRVLVDGQPKADARIQLKQRIAYGNGSHYGKHLDNAYTDGSGRFAFPLLSPGKSYYVRSLDAKYAQLESDRFDLETGQVHEVPTLELTSRDVTISGVAVDEDGKPVSGAEVKTLQDPGLRAIDVTAETDSEGRFTMTEPSLADAGDVEIRHRERGLYGRTSTRIDDDAEFPLTLSLEIKMAPAAVVKGHVLVDGEPVAGVSIRLGQHVTYHGEGYGIGVDQAETDDQGRFVFELAPPGKKFYLSTDDPRFTRLNGRAFDLKTKQVHEYPTIELKRRDMTVSGIVVDPDGNPVAGVLVYAMERGATTTSFMCPQRLTLGDGRFALVGVPNAPLTVVALIPNPPNSSDRRVRFSATADAMGGEKDVRIVLDPRLQQGRPKRID